MTKQPLSFRILDTFTSKLPAHPQTQKPATGQSVVASIRASIKR